MSAIRRPSTPPGAACPGCGQRPNSAEAAARLRAELTVRWLIREADGLVARGFCHECVPSGPVGEVVCGHCGDGPLLGGALAGADPFTDPVVAGWLATQGWALHPAVMCPACRQAFDRASSS
ncbi:hypothetical protein [uncultured Pseudonocardia sp.]|uniref:hypothetical protein n=1 Tax=uncultured Pseudonocardia sp. TaxID=211455 RepID=UPI0026364E43|nr:hypothetical protein [uncultured Pseudonocardia sp.]